MDVIGTEGSASDSVGLADGSTVLLRSSDCVSVTGDGLLRAAGEQQGGGEPLLLHSIHVDDEVKLDQRA